MALVVLEVDMKILFKGKDGGPDSPVTGYWLIEIKWLFSIVILKFDDGRRENYHSHAFNAITWFLCGYLIEEKIINKNRWYKVYRRYKISLLPKITRRDDLHRVESKGCSWCVSIRGPWRDTWEEYCPAHGEVITLTHGRKVLNRRTI